MRALRWLLLSSWTLLFAAGAPAQTLLASGGCRVNIFFSADVPGLVDNQICDELLVQDPAATVGRSVSAGNQRIAGNASIEARAAFGSLGSGVQWGAHAVAGASAASFAAAGQVSSRATDWLQVGGAVGGGPVPVEVTMVLSWDSGLSGNDVRDRNAWMVNAGLSLSFAAGNTAGGVPGDPLSLGFCGATDNLFGITGPALALGCERRGSGPGLVVLSGTFQALPQSTNEMVYSVSTQGSFGGLLGSITAADGALSSGGHLSAMNTLRVYVRSLDPAVEIAFASGATYLAPVPEPNAACLGLSGLLLLLARRRWFGVASRGG